MTFAGSVATVNQIVKQTDLVPHSPQKETHNKSCGFFA